MLPAKEKLQEIVRELAKIMRIQDWDISIEYIDQYEMKHIADYEDLDTMMLCVRYRLRKEAVIYVNTDHTKLDDIWEESIVHELFHIVTGEISDLADDLMDETDVPEITRRQKKQSVENMVVNLSKIFISVYSVKDLAKENTNEGNPVF